MSDMARNEGSNGGFGRAQERDAALLHANDLMPPPSPLEMPEQDFFRHAATARMPEPLSDDMAARRTIVVLATLLLAVAAGTELRVALSRDGLNFADVMLLVLFFPLFAWIAFGFVGSAVGFWQLMTGQTMVEPVPPSTRPVGRTAILVPIRNEDINAVARRITAMASSIAATGAADRFAFFMLSDSGVAEGEEEVKVARRLRRDSPVAVHYRRRAINHARKPGNIAEWVRNNGAAWDYMLVLDADSMMGGRTIAGLAAAMDARPGVGLIQTSPNIIGGQTLFARWHQFATRLYGPVASAGLMWWSGSEATFWGHNAILRTRAFAETCGLPALPGSPPFGGHIMSHDMVEAALLRRAGWGVHMIMVAESYEEYPPTLVDFAIRDRRWCQGNIQHIRLFGAAGFHWVSRMQLIIGASAYITSPLWLLLILAATAGHLTPAGVDALAPSPWILALTFLLLFGPKLMGLIFALSDAKRREGFGGAKRLIASVALEIPLAILTAPATMLTQTMALIDIVRGRASGWAPQSRESNGIALGDAIRHYRPHLIAGVAFILLTLLLDAEMWWIAPVVVGLLSAPFVAAFTSRRDMGERASELGLFQVPGGGEARAPARNEAVTRPVLPRSA